jgi:hypothetical protein
LVNECSNFLINVTEIRSDDELQVIRISCHQSDGSFPEPRSEIPSICINFPFFHLYVLKLTVCAWIISRLNIPNHIKIIVQYFNICWIPDCSYFQCPIEFPQYWPEMLLVISIWHDSWLLSRSINILEIVLQDWWIVSLPTLFPQHMRQFTFPLPLPLSILIRWWSDSRPSDGSAQWFTSLFTFDLFHSHHLRIILVSQHLTFHFQWKKPKTFVVGSVLHQMPLNCLFRMNIRLERCETLS